MKKTTLLLTLLLLIWTGLLSPLAGADEPVVRALLFWSENCAHCHAVIAETLPPLQERYGSQLDVRTVEVSDPTRYELWRSVIETFQVPPERMAVPMLVIGDSVLVGSYEISEALPGVRPGTTGPELPATRLSATRRPRLRRQGGGCPGGVVGPASRNPGRKATDRASGVRRRRRAGG